jgi:nitroreductase
MDLFEAIRERRSVRAFKTTPVPDELIDKVLEAAQWAPSAGNLQARSFIVVKDPKAKAALCAAALHQSFIEEAPVNIVVCADERRSEIRYGQRGRELYSILDASAAVQNLLLAAHALGLGTCWIGAFSDNSVKKILNLPDWLRPIAIIPMGYPDEKPTAPPRVPLSEVTYLDRYGVKR